MKKFICGECGYIGRKKSIRQGSTLMELILILTAVIPGIFYQLWRNSCKKGVCPHCNLQNMVPVDSPSGKKVMKELNTSNDMKVNTKSRLIL